MSQTKVQQWAVRISFFVVFVWFGIPKVLGTSPATALVLDLLKVTLPFIPPQPFLITFGVIESLIGIAFLIPRITKATVIITFVHLCVTLLPLILLPQHTWLSFGVLSTEGQYIVKNIVLFAALWGLFLNYRSEPSDREHL